MDFAYHFTDDGRQLPLTPDTPLNPTILPHVKEYISTLPATPPSPSERETTYSHPSASLLTGLNVLHHSARALENLHHIYATSSFAQGSFQTAVRTIVQCTQRGGRLLVCGIGKSAKIGHKFVATCNSMRIRAQFLHAAEAIHGDLGMIDPERDAILMITYSARTPELLGLMPHIARQTPLAVITGWEPREKDETCPLFLRRPGCGNILLPAPTPVSEEAAFGVKAPTTSTTVALALCDSLALAIAGELHGGGRAVETVFETCHPGGNIGKETRGEIG
jgi:D-arabinose 5-phosphate isomerase GutQ